MDVPSAWDTRALEAARDIVKRVEGMPVVQATAYIQSAVRDAMLWTAAANEKAREDWQIQAGRPELTFAVGCDDCTHLRIAVEEALASLDAGMVQGAADTLRTAIATNGLV